MTPLPHIQYKPGWKFYIEIIRGVPNLTVSTTTSDSYHPENTDYHTAHHFVIPNTAEYVDMDRWVFECIMLVEQHEAMEFYKVDGRRPYAPVHSRAAGRYYDLPPT